VCPVTSAVVVLRLLPIGAPFALANAFLEDLGKKAQWNALARRVGPPEGGPSLKNIRDLLGQFLLPALGSAASTEVIDRIRNPPGPWREVDEGNSKGLW